MKQALSLALCAAALFSVSGFPFEGGELNAQVVQGPHICHEDMAVSISTPPTSWPSWLRERLDKRCKIEFDAEEMALGWTESYLPGGDFEVIAKPYEYRAVIDSRDALLSSAECARVEVITRYIDGDFPDSLRVWESISGDRKDLYRGAGNRANVRYCTAGTGRSQLRVSSGKKVARL